ncbi:hypothetical protein HPB50_022106 [Hyalomma asiaticum]|uniref:Uncharacterized protein n=1 Tax=Hyalomma asiaticum TaxID=266040 RepID=A0ACB7TLI5_HYAAI|nr:hypothetical protein HPB50_022106 [Hyalomma asiaticum]
MRVPWATKTWRRGTLSLMPALCPTADTFSTYVTADADAVTTEQLAEVEIVHVVMGDDDSDECVDDSPEPIVGEPDVLTSTQALDAANMLHRFSGSHNDGKDGLEIAAAAEKAIIRLKKTRQKSITDFFSTK